MSDITINGNNNRVAGETYIEGEVPEICPSCEIRYLTPGRSICRHCEHDEIKRKAHGKCYGRTLILILSLLILSTLSLIYGPQEYRVHTIAIALFSFFWGWVIVYLASIRIIRN